ncbi:ABC transporter permease [Ascidiimonas sp. W6]|uniref:ABC transporter permease n=1 Tax=Ascidiimonas meishanensis TaxID=3128903 RepID=UPI0030ED0AD0
MFDLERWEEIFSTIRKNKLRTFLTGLSVASGIFILVILLGVGQGMRNGIQAEFESDATNRVWVWTYITTKEYKGLNPGRRIQLTNQDFQGFMTSETSRIEYQSSIFRVNANLISYGKQSGSYAVQGVHPDNFFIENQQMSKGRFLNYIDVKNAEKVVVVSTKIARELFLNAKEPIAEYLKISGINFKVIGVYKDAKDEEEDNLFIPITTAQKVFGGGNHISNLTFTVKPEDNFDNTVKTSEELTQNVISYLKESHSVAPEDLSAVNAFNTLKEAKRYFTLIENIKLFFWFVGICTIIAGVVGVSNIMLIIVKERTKEIGIRKALGAKPWSIIGMIIHESIFVTAISGFSGLIVSMAILEILGPNLKVDYLVNPSVDFNVALATVFILILAGALAGFFPAWKAAKIQPIVALKDE